MKEMKRKEQQSSNKEGWEKQRGVKGALMILQMEANEFIQEALRCCLDCDET